MQLESANVDFITLYQHFVILTLHVLVFHVSLPCCSLAGTSEDYAYANDTSSCRHHLHVEHKAISIETERQSFACDDNLQMKY